MAICFSCSPWHIYTNAETFESVNPSIAGTCFVLLALGIEWLSEHIRFRILELQNERNLGDHFIPVYLFLYAKALTLHTNTFVKSICHFPPKLPIWMWQRVNLLLKQNLQGLSFPLCKQLLLPVAFVKILYLNKNTYFQSCKVEKR